MYKAIKIFNEQEELLGEFELFKSAYNYAHKFASLECKELNKSGAYYIDRSKEQEINIINYENGETYIKYIIVN